MNRRPLYRRLLPPRVSDQFDEELRLHLAMRMEEMQRCGMTVEEAERASRARLGDVQQIRNECISIGRRKERRMLRTTIWDHLVQDLTFGLRGLMRNAGWTAVALLTLGLGIGACTAVYSVVNSLLLHPVPYPRGAEVVYLFESPRSAGSFQVFVGPMPDAIMAWRGHTRVLTAIEPYLDNDMTLLRDGAPRVVHAAEITPTFLQFTGGRIIAGRGLAPADVGPGKPRVAVLSESYWRSAFGSDAGIIGRLLVLNGDGYTIIGVASRDVQLVGGQNAPRDVWLPLNIAKSSFGLRSMARLRPGMTVGAAEKELEAIAAAAKVPSSAQFKPMLQLPANMVNFRTSLPILGGAVVLVLLIACANVAHLLLARGVSRERELALRAALGARRGRIVRQLVTESLLLAGLGWIAGVIAGWLGLRLLLAARPESLSELARTTIDLRVLGVALALAALTGLAFGLAVAWQQGRRLPHDALKSGASGGSATRGHHRIRSLLVVTEMALSATLLIGAVLLVRSVIRLQRANIGFDVANVYAFRIGSEFDARPNPDRIAAATARLRALPGFADLTLTRSSPPSAGGMFGALEAEGSNITKPTDFIQYNAVPAGYFRFLRIPMTHGTTFTDTTSNSTQVIVNQGFARNYWGTDNAIGKRLRVDKDTPWLTVVGVVRDISLAGPTANRADPIIYVPGPERDRDPTFLVRMQHGSNPMAAMRGLAAQLAPHAQPPQITDVSDAMDATLAKPRFTMLLLVVFAGIAVILSAIGLYGVLAYAVSERTREIGIRVALGATRQDVLAGVLRSGVGLSLVGVAIGLLATRWTTGVIDKLLYGAPRTDPISLAIGAILMIGVAVVASVAPARRALSIDPMRAIRSD
jgi:putative ABC transport system permease protein